MVEGSFMDKEIDPGIIKKPDSVGTCEVCELQNQKLWYKTDGKDNKILVCFGCIGNYWHDGEK